MGDHRVEIIEKGPFQKIRKRVSVAGSLVPRLGSGESSCHKFIGPLIERKSFGKLLHWEKMDKDCKETFCEATNSPILGMEIKLPIGKYLVKVCGGGAHSVSRVRDANVGFNPNLSVNVMESNPVAPAGKAASSDQAKMPAQSMLEKLVEWFHLYFSDPVMFEKKFPKPFQICTPSATDLQKEVWKTLQERVSFGCTVSYGELATFANRPKAARAIGSAMKNNPNCIVVPCHRVIKASSEIGNYNGGADIKVWLLNHEKQQQGVLRPVSG